MTDHTLTITEDNHAALKRHLFPGDGLEAAAILLCRRVGAERERFIVRQTLKVPHGECVVRTPVSVTWPGQWVEEAIDLAEGAGDTIILTHSHPGGLLAFSTVDDESDGKTIPSLFQGVDHKDAAHGAAIMTPDGAMCARIYTAPGKAKPLKRITRIGVNISDLANISIQNSLPFGADMRRYFRGLTACVIGVSGTGSIVAEQLARMGVGHLILIDFDHVEFKNLDRIINSTVRDAETGRLKPDMMGEAIRNYRPKTKITRINRSIIDPKAIYAASSADVIFSCVDSVEGRLIAERIASSCLIPLIDMGVTIPTRTDKAGVKHIAEIAGRIDYIRPDGPNLSDRGVVTPDSLRREYLMNSAPDAAAEQVKAGYLKGVREEAPSVMSVNMRAASAAVNEWLARQYQFRHDGNEGFARTLFLLASGEEEYSSDDQFVAAASGLLAEGLAEPLLGLPGLTPPRRKDAA